MITIRLVLVLILFLLLFTRQKTSRPLYNDKSLPSNVTVSSELATIPDRICSLWCFTRDRKLRNISCPPNHCYAYGLTFQVNRRTSHALICILLSGDISLNPGPNSQHQQPQMQSLKGYPATCLVINARSLKSLHVTDDKQVCNLSRFQQLVYSESADMVWVTETWLTKDIHNTEILPTGYSIYRKDRKTRNGGGVLLAIKSDSFNSSRELVNSSDLEVTSVEIITHSKLKLLICCCYRPPNAEKIWLDKFNSILADLSSRHDNIIICGDFNFPKVNWQSPAKTFGADEISFTEQLNDFYLTQLNTLATRGVNILDLVISSVPNQINNIIWLNPENSGLFTDHSVIIFDLKTSVRAGPRLNRSVLDFRRGDFDGLRSALQAIDLSTIIQQDSDINEDWLLWKDTFLTTVNDFVPSRKIKGRNSPPWLNGKVIHALRQKEAVRRKLKTSPTVSLKTKFRELRANVKKLVKSSRKNFFSSLDVNFQLNPKRFWSIFKLTNKESSIPESMSMGNADVSASSQFRTASTPITIAEIFNNYFSSVFTNSDSDVSLPPSQPPATDSLLSDVQFTTEEVQETLLALDTSKATGPDNISPKL